MPHIFQNMSRRRHVQAHQRVGNCAPGHFLLFFFLVFVFGLIFEIVFFLSIFSSISEINVCQNNNNIILNVSQNKFTNNKNIVRNNITFCHFVFLNIFPFLAETMNFC